MSIAVRTTITEHFRDRLHAPLANHVNSWGAVSELNGDVFLKVWYDRRERVDGVTYRQLLNPSSFDKQGHAERRRHIELLEAGRRGFMVIVYAQDLDAARRKVGDWSPDRVIPIGRVFWRGQTCWAECLPVVSVNSIVPQ